jgi:hypothetical protein
MMEAAAMTLPSSGPWASTLVTRASTRTFRWALSLPHPYRFWGPVPRLCFGLIASVVCSGRFAIPMAWGERRVTSAWNYGRAARDCSDEGGRLQLGMTVLVEHAGGLRPTGTFAGWSWHCLYVFAAGTSGWLAAHPHISFCICVPNIETYHFSYVLLLWWIHQNLSLNLINGFWFYFYLYVPCTIFLDITTVWSSWIEQQFLLYHVILLSQVFNARKLDGPNISILVREPYLCGHCRKLIPLYTVSYINFPGNFSSTVTLSSQWHLWLVPVVLTLLGKRLCNS